jgi:hypothetical protein
VRPAGGATAHLTMLAGRYGGFTSYQVGFAAFVRLAIAIKAALDPGRPGRGPGVRRAGDLRADHGRAAAQLTC